MTINDWIDFDGKLTADQIRLALPGGLAGHLIREDVFDRYTDGHTIRRVYVQRNK